MDASMTSQQNVCCVRAPNPPCLCRLRPLCRVLLKVRQRSSRSLSGTSAGLPSRRLPLVAVAVAGRLRWCWPVGPCATWLPVQVMSQRRRSMACLEMCEQRRMFQYVVYDNACMLTKFVANRFRSARAPGEIAHHLHRVYYVLDRFHERNRRELSSSAAEVAHSGQFVKKAAPYDAALLRMAIQFGFYWWHVSNADASLAERSLSHAVQSFHVAHWCHSAWRGANLGGWMLLEPGPASPFFNVCHAKILELSGGPAQDSRGKLLAGLASAASRRAWRHPVHGTLSARILPDWAMSTPSALLCKRLAERACGTLLEQTFADIARTGLNAVRVPFGHWVVQGPGSGEPYEGPCLEAVEVLRLLAARYCDKSCVTGVQVCNEPSENIPADRLLCDFYEQAIEAIRSSGMGPDKVAVVLPIFTHWRMKEMLNCWNSRRNSFKFDNIAFDIHYYHDFSAIWRLLPHYRHIEVVAEHARELKLLPGSVVGEWSLSRPGYFSEEEKADFAQKQVVAYNHASHGWFFWNWHDHAFYPDWDLEKGVFGSGKLPCPLRQEELQGFLFPAWEGSGPVTRPLAQAERELMRLKESLTKDTSQFPAMARKHSECKSALQPGQMAGDLGWISKGSLGDQTMEDVVLALEVNELSDLVTTARGVHLVQRYA
eukprot:s2059_g3.t5